MRKWLTLLFAFALAGMAHADEPVPVPDSDRLTVVELFTSQGCSSCPPADAALRSLRDRPGILTLSWPVDYWDRLGWEDTFANPHNAMRQAAYNKRLGRGGVFTPQMIIDGWVQCVGSKPEEIRTSIDTARTTARLNMPVSLRLDGDELVIDLSDNKLNDVAAVRVVWYLADAEVEIGGGENRGRKLYYTNVVRASDLLDDWHGKAGERRLKLTDGIAAGADHVAILLQDGYGHGAIIGAASLRIQAAPTVLHVNMP